MSSNGSFTSQLPQPRCRTAESRWDLHPTSPRRNRLVYLVVASVLACWAVPSGPPLQAAPPHTISPVPNPFDADWPDVYLVVARKCAGCHIPGGESFDLSTYDAIISAKTESGEPVVIPGDPENSPLWTSVAWNVENLRDSTLEDEPEMPAGDDIEWLTKGQLEQLWSWIERGAHQYCESADPHQPRHLLEIDFPSAQDCRVCHPGQYEDWSRSMHSYAQQSPVFEAFTQTLLERTSGTIGTFCTRCHTPLGIALGENGLTHNVNRSRLSLEGVTCVVCHRLPQPQYKSNGRLPTPPGKIFERCMYGPFVDPVDVPVKTHPAGGARYIKTAAFCGSCHDVTNPAGVRLEEAFSEWQNSPAARKGITCQQCHMGPVQGKPIADEMRPWGRAAEVPGIDPKLIPMRPLSDHTFAGPDYSLLPDTEFPEKLDWMYEQDYRCSEDLTPYQKKTLVQLRRRNRRQLDIARAKRYQLLVGAATLHISAPRFAKCRERIEVRIDVTSNVAGHNFPTGFTAERQLWVEVTLIDPAGRPVFQSGDLDSNGDLRDSHSHEVEAGKIPHDKYLLNFQSKFVALTNKGTERSVVIPVNRHLAPLNILRPATGISASFGRPPTFRVSKGSLPPLGTLGRDYPIRLPRTPGLYHLHVRLNFRHLPPVLLDKIGIPNLKHLLEIVEIDQAATAIRVGHPRATAR